MSKPTGKTFNITSFDDFKKVPYHRLDACLKEFCAEVRRVVLTDRVFRAEHPGEAPVEFVGIEWIDDGDETSRPTKYIVKEEE